MNILVEKNKILSPISKLVNITEKRSLMPILSNILIIFGRDKTIIYSTDLEISAIASIDYKSDYETRIVVHGRKFADILREMDNGDIELTIDSNILTIKQKKTEFVLSLQDPEEFPEIKELKGKEEYYIKGKDIIEMVEKVLFAVSSDESRYVLTGMFMEGKNGKVRVVGTDGFRMSFYQKSIEDIKDFKGVIIPKRSVNEIDKMFSEESDIKIVIDEKHVQFSDGNVVLISRIIEGNFPDYENVLPVTKSIVSIKKDILLRGLKKVSTILGKSEPVKISLGRNKMEIDGESELGRAKEIVETEYDGEDQIINFNSKFLLDVVQHLDGEIINLRVPGSHGAVLIEQKDNEDYKNIVMPIRI